MGLVDAFVAFALKNLRYPWSRLRQRLCEGRYLKKELPPADSLNAIQDCLKKITWTQDGFFHLYDALSYPQTVWAKKKDDCDGFAVLAAELIQRLSPPRHPVLVTAVVRPLSKSHTVCAFKDGRKYPLHKHGHPYQRLMQHELKPSRNQLHEAYKSSLKWR